ncbi:hypothetical protein GO009_02445 [Muricauda sp. TY007]|uniref:Uncharacterized protein n=1 Tax=Flagellimonas aurea TaxID=2915619 RepID=A0ABS3GB58_9FLAO|nr:MULTISPECIES: hypothetical protein [Allomuricauda]MBO0356297.1 hypothetical protein [Allomuricauda aurea]NDV14872.1 hypothetical protein [Muricauda sp. TY007]
MNLVYNGGSTIQSTGNSGGNVAGGGVSTVFATVSKLSSITSVFSGLISSKTIAKTIGQALSDGWDCWGSTWTPSRAENEMGYWCSLIAQEFKESLDVTRNNLEDSLNNFFQNFWGDIASDYDSRKTLESWIGWRYDSAKDCTLRGLVALEKGVDDYISTTIVNAIKEVCKEINAVPTITTREITLYRTEDNKKPYKKTVPKVKLELKVDVVEDVKDLAGNKSVQLFGGVALVVAALFAAFAKNPDGKKRKKGKKLFR